MRAQNIGDVLVAGDHQLMGVLTDRVAPYEGRDGVGAGKGE